MSYDLNGFVRANLSFISVIRMESFLVAHTHFFNDNNYINYIIDFKRERLRYFLLFVNHPTLLLYTTTAVVTCDIAMAKVTTWGTPLPGIILTSGIILGAHYAQSQPTKTFSVVLPKYTLFI